MLLFGKRHKELPTGAVNAPASHLKTYDRPAASPFQLYQPATGSTWSLRQGENTIGRGLENDIILRDPSVSRRHAIIYVDGPNVYIEDAGSANGVWMAGQRVRQAPVIRDAIICIAQVQLTVRKPTVFEDGEAYGWMTARG